MFACHLDMNFAAFTGPAVRHFLRQAALAGFDTVVWEIEDKVRLDGLGKAVHPDAFSKDEFRELLDYARSLHLKAIPLLQTLGHAEYVLKVPEHDSLKENHSPDCYCTSSAEVREFLRKLIVEIAELFDNPEFFHLGGDEAYNFGTCPKCAAADHSRLFIEHEMALAEPLLERGIRPCLWADMVRNHPEAREKLDRRFQIWLWNYSYTSFWEDELLLKNAGFQLVICPASSSCGDSPFLPQWSYHCDNISGAAQTALKHGEAGLCITSWSIRMGLKSLQIPLWELGQRVYLQQENSEQAEDAVRKKYFGEKNPDDWGKWDYVLGLLTAIQWTRYKDGLLPPENFLAGQWKKHKEKFQGLPALVEKLLDCPAENDYPEGVIAEFDVPVKTGIGLRRRYLELVRKILMGHMASPGELAAEREAFARYLGREQTADSAEHNAALVYNPLIEYVG